MGSASVCDAFVATLLEKSRGIIKRAFGVDYRLSSAAPFLQSNPFPAALIDALSGYFYLVKGLGFEPKNIIVEGISAGGHLAISLVRYLNHASIPGLCRPGGLLLISPTGDWGGTHDGLDSSLERNKSFDFVYHFLKSGYSARALLGKLPVERLCQSPWLSPASKEINPFEGNFKMFPKTCVLAGGVEVGLDQIKTLRDRIITDNNPSTLLYLEYPDAIHVFPLIAWHEPERSEAVAACSIWMKELCEWSLGF